MNKEAFNKIINIEYLNEFKGWLEGATSDEIKGLQLIEQIYNTKGRVKLGEQLPYGRNKSTGKVFEYKWIQRSLKTAEDNYRLKQITTSYQWTFGVAKNQRPKQTILKYKNLSQLSLGEVLTDSARSFIDNWLTLGDDVVREELILSTLRALQAKLVIKESNNTEMKTKYVWKTDWNLSNPLRMDKAGSTLFGFQPNLKAIQRQRIKEEKLRQRLEELEDSDIVHKLTIYKQFKIN